MSPDHTGSIDGFDHVSLPMRDTDAMVAFYRSLGLKVAEHPHVVSVYASDQMINLHRPGTWQREDFTLRAPAAKPPCGDLCFVWDGSTESLHALLDEAALAAAITCSRRGADPPTRADLTARYRVVGG